MYQEEKIMKKNGVLAILAAVALLIPVAGCSESTTTSASAKSTAASSSAASKAVSKTANSSKTGPVSGTVGSYDVSIESVKIGKDYDGKKVASVKMKWTNNSKKADSAISSLMITVYQDGVQLENATLDGDPLADNESKSIQPGKSLEFSGAFALTGKENKIQVDVSDIASLGNNKISTTLNLK
jgi:hypothetical protein